MSRVEAASPPRASASPDAAALAAGLFTVTLWGSAFVGIRAAGAAFSPGSLALGRLLVSCLLLGGVALIRRDPLPSRRDLVPIAVYGVLWLAVYSTALNAAERIVDAGTASLLVNVGPIVIALLAGKFLGEGFPARLFVGCAIAFAGCALIGFATAQSRTGAVAGIALLAIAVLAYSTAIVVQKPVLARVPSFQVTLFGIIAATIACLPFAPALASEMSKADASAIAWIVYLGAFPTAIGFATWGFALRRTRAGQLGTFTYLAPVIAVLLSWVVLRETPPWLAIAGGALSLAGVYVARRVPAKPRQEAGLTR
ncbi:MAG TPA: DMT family transporter [Candidatus Dormibacteraeota bacterium]|nr:DMT family transporter [Candidatus Dormibacteraeota bacterium]